MSNSRILLYEIKRFGNELRDQYQVKGSYRARKQVQDCLGPLLFCLTGTRLNLQRLVKLKVPRVIYASLLSLTGCATSAELEFLRAEVARANAVAARAEASVSRTQRQLTALQEASESRETYSEPPTATSASAKGYKWGNLRQD